MVLCDGVTAVFLQLFLELFGNLYISFVSLGVNVNFPDRFRAYDAFAEDAGELTLIVIRNESG